MCHVSLSFGFRLIRFPRTLKLAICCFAVTACCHTVTAKQQAYPGIEFWLHRGLEHINTFVCYIHIIVSGHFVSTVMIYAPGSISGYACCCAVTVWQQKNSKTANRQIGDTIFFSIQIINMIDPSPHPRISTLTECSNVKLQKILAGNELSL